ncbi:MAG: PDZ domain-containing protein [Rhodomicrobium sp.]
MRFSVLKVSSGEADILLGLDFMGSKKLWISYATRTMFIQPKAAALPQGLAAGTQGLTSPGGQQDSRFWKMVPGMPPTSAAPPPRPQFMPAAEDGYLGASLRDLMEKTPKGLELPGGLGAMVARVVPGSPAAAAGLLPGDVPLSVDGDVVTEDVSWHLGRKHKSGETVILGILRQKQLMTVRAKLIGASAGSTLGVAGGGANLIITSEKRIAELFPLADFPLEWAHAQDNIALAYSERPDGDKAENSEKSIPYYEAALSVEVFRKRIAWDKAQINLGLAYQQRKQGSRQDNLERAIAAFSAVVTERPKSNTEWARAQMLLGYAYVDRLAGDRNGNYLHAIAAFEATLPVKSSSVSPEQKAEIQDRLGDLYLVIEPLNAQENIEHAIAAYQQVLKYKPGNNQQRQRWASAAEKLGNCYRLRKEDSLLETTTLAVKAYEQALTIFTRENYPEDNARVQALKDGVQAKAGAGPASNPL